MLFNEDCRRSIGVYKVSTKFFYLTKSMNMMEGCVRYSNEQSQYSHELALVCFFRMKHNGQNHPFRAHLAYLSILTGAISAVRVWPSMKENETTIYSESICI